MHLGCNLGALNNIRRNVRHRRKLCGFLLEWQKTNWVGQILRKNCLLKRAIEGNVQGKGEVTGKRGRRRNVLLDGTNETRRYFRTERGSN